MATTTAVLRLLIITVTTIAVTTTVATTTEAWCPHHKEMEIRMNIYSKIKEQLYTMRPRYCSRALLEQTWGSAAPLVVSSISNARGLKIE